MSDKLSQLDRLNKLLDEGRISESEYTDLKADVLNKPGVEQATHSMGDSSDPRSTLTQTPTQGDTPSIYKIALGAGVVSIFFGGTFGILAWATVAIGAWALYSVKAEKRRWMAWAGLALGILFSLMNLYLNGHIESALDIGEEAPASAMTEAEAAGVRAYCDAKEVIPNCSDLAAVMHAEGCTVDKAMGIIDWDATAHMIGPPDPDDGTLVRNMKTPKGILGAAVSCAP